ncbi:hypothetical protein Pyn_25552 [Prunus yedoensis var. nudiflora]|uniref:Uncharacterized protein n=1 Tax=Prunus yedoensis var. nudiflora TaxID=2094558 RepID=A0A314YWW4_PRUYE|nr:hypothetical protein Pyn_25552 [Prunus yedoensis var. nudiflora]
MSYSSCLCQHLDVHVVDRMEKRKKIQYIDFHQAPPPLADIPTTRLGSSPTQAEQRSQKDPSFRFGPVEAGRNPGREAEPTRDASAQVEDRRRPRRPPRG